MHTYSTLSTEELAHQAALEPFDYEIAKNLRQIAELRKLADACYANGQHAEAASYQRTIREKDKRIAFWKRQRFEVDEREKQFKESQIDYSDN